MVKITHLIRKIDALYIKKHILGKKYASTGIFYIDMKGVKERWKKRLK